MSRIVDTIRHEQPREAQPQAQRRAPRRTGPAPELGVVQYFHMHDYEAVERALDALAQLPVKRLRTSISWCDWLSGGGEAWYRWLLSKLTASVSVLPCFLYTPPALG